MTWYEDERSFRSTEVLPPDLNALSGPRNTALVSVYEEGRTTPGWGERLFMQNYLRDKFAAPPRIARAAKGQPYAIVMRSIRAIMIDLDRHTDDGGADGFEAAAKLDLPPTLAETSKSGTGRHLFYKVTDFWDDDLGFAAYEDIIGLQPGIDIRGVGCSYRYPTQRWNDRSIAHAPDSLLELIEERRARKLALTTQLAAAAADPDSEEALIMHDTLLQELAKPIPNGKRNSTLFAIGSKMNQAGVPDWQTHLSERANEVGIDTDEAVKIIDNVVKYG